VYQRNVRGSRGSFAIENRFSAFLPLARLVDGINLQSKRAYCAVGNGVYSYSATHDSDLRLASESLTNVSTGVTLYSSTRGYDPVGNVTSVNTTLATGTDNQVFCYDAFNRLVWAGSTGTPSCGGSVTQGSLTSATYTETDSYDAIGRLTSNSTTGGSYTYGDSAHVHAVTAIGSVYHATYDAAGDLTCRALSGFACGGNHAQSLSYSNERLLAHWQNMTSSPTVQDDFLYDGSGQRMEQSVTSKRVGQRVLHFDLSSTV